MSEFTNEGFNVGYRAGILSERERIIALLTATYGENYVDMGVVGQVVALIKGENE